MEATTHKKKVPEAKAGSIHSKNAVNQKPQPLQKSTNSLNKISTASKPISKNYC